MNGSKEVRSSQDKVILICLATFLWGIIAHAYMFFDFYPSHDSLMIVTMDEEWEVSLGRFMEPIYVFIRGAINAPWLLGILSLLFLSLSLFFIIELLNITRIVSIIILCGLFTTHITITALYATYMPFVDIYMLSLLFVSSGIYLLEKYKNGILLSVIFLTISLGLYQSYISCAITLMLFLILKKVIEGINPGQLVKTLIKYGVCLVASAVLYLILTKISLQLCNITLADNYNSLSNLLKNEFKSILKLILNAYSHFFSSFWLLSSYNTSFIRFCKMVLFGVGCITWTTYLRDLKITLTNRLIIASCILILPLCVDFTFIMALGWAHTLMLFSFGLLLLLLFIPIENIHIEGKKTIVQYYIMIITCCCILFHNIVYANGAYYYKNLIGKKTDFYMVSLINEMDRMPEYVSGETPVVIIGDFDMSYIANEHWGFEKYNDLIGMSPSSITYLDSFSRYCSEVLGNPINLVFEENSIEYFSQLEEVKDMPIFPKKGFCKIINDTMVIKLQSL